MPVSKRLCVLFIILWIPIVLWTYGSIFGIGEISEFFYVKGLQTPLLNNFIYYFLYGAIPSLIALIVAYNINKSKIRFALLILAFIYLSSLVWLSIDALVYFNRVKTDFNPETVQSTMVEIDLQQLKDLQNNTEGTMIYFGRPSCAHCSEIKPNLDILVNNSHSTVYYYNTEQDRDDNHDEMQAVLNTYGVSTVPALVVWADSGETKEIYFNEDIVDYFLDTNRFRY